MVESLVEEIEESLPELIVSAADGKAFGKYIGRRHHEGRTPIEIVSEIYLFDGDYLTREIAPDVVKRAISTVNGDARTRKVVSSIAVSGFDPSSWDLDDPDFKFPPITEYLSLTDDLWEQGDRSVFELSALVRENLPDITAEYMFGDFAPKVEGLEDASSKFLARLDEVWEERSAEVERLSTERDEDNA